jgi:hypothetical protein
MARAGDKPDPALLEFLGSVDTEDKGFHEYLAHTDIDQVAKRAASARGVPAPGSTPPAPAAEPASKNPPPAVAPVSTAVSSPPPVSHP